MIAQRFRPVGWVAGVAVAATALYMVSLRVASERGRLETIDHKIASTQREIRQLQTELGTRASLRQLEKWNSETFSMSAPQVGQYLAGAHDLASVDQTQLGDKPSAPPPVMAAISIVEPLEADAAAKPAPQPVVVALASLAKPATKDQSAQRTIKSDQPRESKAQKPAAPIKVAMLDKAAIRDLARAAHSETGNAPRSNAGSKSKK